MFTHVYRWISAVGLGAVSTECIAGGERPEGAGSDDTTTTEAQENGSAAENVAEASDALSLSSSTYPLHPHGSSGGGANPPIACPTGWVATGIFGKRSGSYVNSIHRKLLGLGLSGLMLAGGCAPQPPGPVAAPDTAARAAPDTAAKKSMQILGKQYPCTESLVLDEKGLSMRLFTATNNPSAVKMSGNYQNGAVVFEVELEKGVLSETTIVVNGEDKFFISYNDKGIPSVRLTSPEGKGECNLTKEDVTKVKEAAAAFSQMTSQDKEKKLDPGMLVSKCENAAYQWLGHIAHFYSEGGRIVQGGSPDAQGASSASLSPDDEAPLHSSREPQVAPPAASLLGISLPVAAAVRRIRSLNAFETNDTYCPGTAVTWANTLCPVGCHCEPGNSSFCNSNQVTSTFTTTGRTSFCHGRCGAGCEGDGGAFQCTGSRYTPTCIVHDGTGNPGAFFVSIGDCTYNGPALRRFECR